MMRRHYTLMPPLHFCFRDIARRYYDRQLPIFSQLVTPLLFAVAASELPPRHDAIFAAYAIYDAATCRRC